MKVELNNDAVDALLKSVLLQDYKCLTKDIQRLSKLENSFEYQKEDLENNLRYIQAMETILEYYVGMHWRDELQWPE